MRKLQTLFYESHENYLLVQKFVIILGRGKFKVSEAVRIERFFI